MQDKREQIRENKQSAKVTLNGAWFSKSTRDIQEMWEKERESLPVLLRLHEVLLQISEESILLKDSQSFSDKRE